MAITTLLEAAIDRDDKVRDTVVASLRRLARKYPAEVLQNASAFRQKNLKVNIMLFKKYFKSYSNYVYDRILLYVCFFHFLAHL